ncbi:unnamed protein product, partial [Musa hybrid cultivar]
KNIYIFTFAFTEPSKVVRERARATEILSLLEMPSQKGEKKKNLRMARCNLPKIVKFRKRKKQGKLSLSLSLSHLSSLISQGHLTFLPGPP